MKYLKIFEEFGEFQLDEISEQEFSKINDGPTFDLGLDNINKMKSNLDPEWKVRFARSQRLPREEYPPSYQNLSLVNEVSQGKRSYLSKGIYIEKKQLNDDDPIYTLEFRKRHPKTYLVLDSRYFTFEESDFRKICENPQILLDYINSIDVS